MFWSRRRPKKIAGGFPADERKRWSGFNPQNPLDFAQNGFGFRPTNTMFIS
jgi:hypothetical protein